MNPLLKRLASLRLKVRFLEGWQGACALLTLVLGVGLAVGMTDYWIHLPSLVRALALMTILVGGGLIAYGYLYLPLSKPCDNLSLALRVEDAYPELNYALATTVQFLSQSTNDETRVGDSSAMREQTIQQTLTRAEPCDFSRIIDRRAAIVFGCSAVLILLAVGTVVRAHPQFAGIGLLRLVEPFGQHTWTRITVARSYPNAEDKWKSIDTTGKAADRIAVGQPYQVKVALQGKIPAQATIEIVGTLRTDRTEILKPDPNNPQSASFVASIDMTQQRQKFKFRVVANDGSFPPRSGSWHEVEVLPPPSLVDLDGQPSPQITTYPPAYTDLPSAIQLPPGTRHLDLFAGTNVVLRARANRPLEQAWVEYSPENLLVTTASMLSILGQTNPLQMTVQAGGNHDIWGRHYASLSSDEMTFQINFMPWITGSYVLHLRDKDGLESRSPSDLRVQTDPVPDVKLVRPGSSVTALPDADIAFKFKVTDELFAIRSVYAEYQRKNPDGTPRDRRQRTVLYDAKDYGKLLPYLLAKMGKAWWTGPEPRLRFKELDFETVWSLKDHKFESGDLVVVELCADDFCNIYPTREAGRSHAIEIRIVSRSQLIGQMSQKLADIQQPLHRAEKMQDKALKITKETQKADKIDQAVKDAFVEGEQLSRELQDMIGRNPDQGLRQTLGEIKEVLKENKLTDTDVYKQASKIKGALDGMASRELQQIEPKLSAVRNDLTQNDKNNPQIKKKLDETAKQQTKVLEGIKELNHDLAPMQTMFEAQLKVRDLIQKQQDILKDLKDLKASNEEKDNKDELQNRDKIANKMQEQKELAQQLEKVIDELKRQQQKRSDDGDKENAEKLKKAIQQLEPKLEEEKKDPQPKKAQDKTPTAAKMKAAADELRNKNEVPQTQIDNQEQIVKDLEKTLDVLEGKNKDFLKEELNQRLAAEKKIDNFADRLKDLEKKEKDLRKEEKELKAEMKKLKDEGKDTKKLEEQQERLNKKKEELQQKEAQLQQEIEKTARQLARLQEPRAANEMKDAAEELEKAIENQKAGGDGAEEQKKVKERLEQAKAELKQAEQELSREMLIQLNDKLTGLKERQDAALQRSEDLHAKILSRKSWTEGLLGTIEGNMEGQKMIADETDTLKEKIKDAKVFHGILERAKDSMDKAVEVMENRRDLGKERRYIEKGDGEKIEGDELKDEIDYHTKTIKFQKQAAQRIDRLLDAIKEEVAKKPKKQEDKKEVAKDGENPNEKKDPPPQGRPDPNGIPPMAQLKALTAEQIDLYERTEEFAKMNPNLTKLNDEQRRELRELEQEQERLQSLFQEMVAPPPEPKEGDPQ